MIDGQLVIKTPTAIAGIRGTELAVDVADDGSTTIRLIEGEVDVAGLKGPKTILSAGEQCIVAADAATLNKSPLNLKESDKWWSDWPTLVPIGEQPSDPDIGPSDPDPQDVATETLAAVADSHVYAYDYSGWNKANWGAYDRIGAGWHPTGGEKRTYLQFDLAGVDPARVNQATLRLFHYHTGGGNALALEVYRVTEPWTEGAGTYKPSTPAGLGEICWIHQPSVESSPAAQFHPGPGVDKWVEVDISPLVRAWLSGTPNHGLMIKAQGALSRDTPHAEYGFHSREGDAEKRPGLVLSDGIATPPPAGAPQQFDQAVARLCAPDEDFVRSLYHCITHREPTAQEVQEQIKRLRAGAPRQHMIAYFFASPGYVNLNHDGVRFMTDACQAIYARQPTATDLKAWPRTDRKTIINEMFKNPAHLAATKDCEALWRKKPAGDTPAVAPDNAGWKTQHAGPHGSICPKADQWSTSGGGFVAMSGSHRFDKRWSRSLGGEKNPDVLDDQVPNLPNNFGECRFSARDLFYVNDEDTKSPPRHSFAEVMRHAKIKQGTITVRGPGALALYFRRKQGSPFIRLYDATTGQRFGIHAGGDQTMYQARNWVFKDGKWDGAWTGEYSGKVNDLYGDRPMYGWVPAGQIKTLDLFVEQGCYHNVFPAPSEIEYELWFFPREGGGVKTELSPDLVAHPEISSNAQEPKPATATMEPPATTDLGKAKLKKKEE